MAKKKKRGLKKGSKCIKFGRNKKGHKVCRKWRVGRGKK